MELLLKFKLGKMAKAFKCERGVIVFETTLLIQLLLFLLVWGHVEIVKLWRSKIDRLQKERSSYDGETKWKR